MTTPTPPSTAAYVLKTPDTGSLPNSSTLSVGDGLALQLDSYNTTIVPNKPLKQLSDLQTTGLVAQTALGLKTMTLKGSTSLKINNASGENGNIDLSVMPDSTDQLIQGSFDDTNYAQIEKLTFIAGENISIKGFDQGAQNRTTFYIKNTELENELIRPILASVQDGCENVLVLTSVSNLEDNTIALTAGYNLTSPVVGDGQMIECLKEGEVNELIWGEPLSNLQSITIAPSNAVFTLVAAPTTITDGLDGTLTLQVAPPSTPGVKLLGYDTTANEAKWYDYSDTGISELSMRVPLSNDMNTMFEITCTVDQPLTDTGEFILNALPQTDSKVIGFDTLSILPQDALTNADLTIRASSIDVMDSNNVGDYKDKNYELSFNTTGAVLLDGFQYDASQTEMKRVNLTALTKVSSVGINIATDSQGVLEVAGTNPITTTGTMTVKHKDVPFPTFAGVNQYGQSPTYYGNNKMEYGKLSSGPLLRISSGISTFPPPTGAAPTYTVTTNAFTQTIAGLDPTRIIAIATDGGFPQNLGTMCEGTLKCIVTYASDSLNLQIESNYSTRLTNEQNTTTYWMLYYYPDY